MQTNFVDLRISIMEEEMILAIQKHFTTKEEDVKEILKQSISNFNYKEEIEKQVHIFIKKSVESNIRAFFMYGGGQKIIKDLIDKMLVEATNV